MSKAIGDQCFKDKKYEEAIRAYTEAEEGMGMENALRARIASNRSLCHLRLDQYGSAMEAASLAIQLDPSFVKPYYRRGMAWLALAKTEKALLDFEILCSLTKDPLAIHQRNLCRKAIRAKKFAMAIASEASESPFDKLIRVGLKPLPEADWVLPVKGGQPTWTPAFVQEMMQRLKAQEKMPFALVQHLLLSCYQKMKDTDTLQYIQVPKGGHITVCGDVHGQFYDLLNLFDLHGLPTAMNPFVFNGDFVDRGSFSVEVMLTLMAWKVACPDAIYLHRGNHETKNMNSLYGFEGEVKHKYDASLMPLFSTFFQSLPLASVIEPFRVLVLHGGLFSSDDTTLETLSKTHRFREPPEQGPMSEALWSDPQAQTGRAPSKRGVALMFGPDVTERFCEKNEISMVVRSHEVKPKGHEYMFGGRLLTVFSAPNYCDQMGNLGATVRFQYTEDVDTWNHPVALDRLAAVQTVRTFAAVPHPASRPMQYAGNSMFQQFA